jgi:hypothetical protein
VRQALPKDLPGLFILTERNQLCVQVCDRNRAFGTAKQIAAILKQLNILLAWFYWYAYYAS